MSADIEDLLDQASAGHIPPLDVGKLAQRAGRARRQRRLSSGGGGLAALAIVAFGIAAAVQTSYIELRGPASRPASISVLERPQGPHDRLPPHHDRGGAANVRLARDEGSVRVFVYKDTSGDCLLLAEVASDKGVTTCIDDLLQTVEQHGMAFIGASSLRRCAKMDGTLDYAKMMVASRRPSGISLVAILLESSISVCTLLETNRHSSSEGSPRLPRHRP